jgi:hypothetical protein
MSPITHSDGHDPPGLIDEFVPRVAAVIDDIVVGFEHPVGEPVLAHELPDVFGWVEFGAFGRQRNERDVGWHDEAGGHVPSRLVHEEHGERAWRHFGGDFCQVQAHRLDIADRQDKPCAFAFFGADGAEDVGRSSALVVWGRGPCAALGPAPRDLVLLADAGFIGEPDLYGSRLDAFLARDFVKERGEVFLYSSIAPSAWA